jgi:hypothetical protein
MKESLLATEKHPNSLRTALVADEGASVWLYLTEADSLRPIADCWLFNTVPTPTNLQNVKPDGPPPATGQFAVPNAQLGVPAPEQVHFQWSLDGQSVAAYVQDELLGFIIAGQKSGFSKHLHTTGPFGSQLDNAQFKNFFG